MDLSLPSFFQYFIRRWISRVDEWVPKCAQEGSIAEACLAEAGGTTAVCENHNKHVNANLTPTKLQSKRAVVAYVKMVNKMMQTNIDDLLRGERTSLQAVRSGYIAAQAPFSRERTGDVAAWLAQHPAIGLKHMLHLMRAQRHCACSMDAVARVWMVASNNAG